MNSSSLSLPYLAPGQAQKHVTVNESLRKLDAVVQLSVVSATTTAQPGSPTDGAVYIIPSGKTGAQWAAFANGSLGYYRDGAWEQITPREGWIAYIKDAGLLQVYTGSGWSQATLRTALGLGTAATQNTGASGANVPLLSQQNVFSDRQQIVAPASASIFERVATGGVTGYYEGERLRINNDAGGSAYSDMVSLQIGVNALAIEVRDQSNTKGNLYLQPYGGTVRTGGPMTPVADNTQALGGAFFRWSVVYAGTGAINTSDAREKTGLRALNAAERRAIRRAMAGVGVYQWLSAVADKGEGARLHVGVTAQAVAEAFAAEGLDPARYALWCEDSMTADASIVSEVAIPASSRFGVRYDQLFAMAIAALFDPD